MEMLDKDPETSNYSNGSCLNENCANRYEDDRFLSRYCKELLVKNDILRYFACE